MLRSYPDRAGDRPLRPGAVRASTGAVFSQTLVRTTFSELAAWAGRLGIALVGTSGEVETDYRDFIYPSAVVIVMGSEREGLSEEQKAACDFVVSIPMAGRVDSLNLAVAAGLVLYEVFRQRRAGPDGVCGPA